MPNTIFSFLAAALVWIAPELFSDLSFDQALAKAQADKKIVMIDFFTTWCGPCKRLDSTTWKDAQVNTWAAEKCIALKVDAEKQVELAKRYKIEAYPTIVFLKPDGTEIDRLVGYRGAQQFLEDANAALSGKTTAVRAEEAISRAKEKLTGRENDPMARLTYADVLASNGMHEQALAEYLWCFDHGGETPAFAGVRLSFLLLDIDQLGAKYPPAIKALEERRDSAEARLDAGSDSAADVKDVVALNDRLKQNERTLALYDRMRDAQRLTPKLRGVFARLVFPRLGAAKRYAEVLELVEDPERYIDQAIKLVEFTGGITPSDDSNKASTEAALAQTKSRLVTECSTLYEAALATAKPELAQRIAERLIVFHEALATYLTLIDSAARAGSLDVAKTIAERASSAFPTEKDKQKIARALERASKPK